MSRRAASTGSVGSRALGSAEVYALAMLWVLSQSMSFVYSIVPRTAGVANFFRENCLPVEERLTEGVYSAWAGTQGLLARFGVRRLDAALDLWIFGFADAAPIQSGVQPPHSKKSQA